MKGKTTCKHKLTLENKDKKKTETSQDLDIDITTKTFEARALNNLLGYRFHHQGIAKTLARSPANAAKGRDKLEENFRVQRS